METGWQALNFWKNAAFFFNLYTFRLCKIFFGTSQPRWHKGAGAKKLLILYILVKVATSEFIFMVSHSPDPEGSRSAFLCMFWR